MLKKKVTMTNYKMVQKERINIIKKKTKLLCWKKSINLFGPSSVRSAAASFLQKQEQANIIISPAN